MHVTEFRVHTLFSGIEKAVRSFSKPDIAFVIEEDEEVPYLETDRYRVEQILMNFLTNAFKYTEKGSVTLSIARMNSFRARLSVSDTGRGIAPEVVGRLFEQFRQVEARDSSVGFGLGLFLTREIAKLLHGEVGVESSEKGSTFWLELPLDDTLTAQFESSSTSLPVVLKKSDKN